MFTYRMGNAYNVKAKKLYHCVEVMINGKWMPVILDHGLAIYEDYTTCYSCYTKLIAAEKNNPKNNVSLNEKNNNSNKDVEMSQLKNELEKYKRVVGELSKKLKTQNIPAPNEKDLSELGVENRNDN